MKIPVFALSAVLGLVLAVEAWTLKSVVELKIQVATLATKIDLAKFAKN